MRGDSFQTWFRDEQEHLQTGTLSGKPMESSDGQHSANHTSKMADPTFDYHDLDMFEQYSESLQSSTQFNHLTSTSDQNSSDVRDTPVDTSSFVAQQGLGLDGVSPGPFVGDTYRVSETSKIAYTPPGPLQTQSPSVKISLSDNEDSALYDTSGLTQRDTKPFADTPQKGIKRKRSQKISAPPVAEPVARSSIPLRLSWMEYARQGILAAYSSRLNPYALHPGEYELLRSFITKPQVTTYLNIRNGILRLWHRNPLVAVTKLEAAGCVKEPRYFPLASVAFEWLLRNGYINFGCVEAPVPPIGGTTKSTKRKTIVIIGAGMSGLGCARHLEHLFQHHAGEFAKRKEQPPRVLILEGRERIGGRVFSHPLLKQGGLSHDMRSTVEMGAQIVTGFDHGNPLSFIIRGQLAIPYHLFRDINSPLYDADGQKVNSEKDLKVEKLWNDTLERASVFRNKLPTVRTVAGDRKMVAFSEDVKEGSTGEDKLLSMLEDEGLEVNVDDGNPISLNADIPEKSAVGVEKLAGRQYQLGRPSAKLPAAQAAKEIGWKLRDSIKHDNNIDLLQIASSEHPTLGQALDEGIRQYQEMIELTEQDFRLLNWHHANLEYANATNLDQLSLAGWDQDIGNEFEGSHSQIIGGYTQVPRGLWKLPYPLEVKFRQTVEEIHVSQATEQKSEQTVSLKCSNGEVIKADRIVLSAPLGVLQSRDIKFVPPLPQWKSECIDRMGFGLLNKVVLVFDECFWNPDQDIYGLLNAASLSEDPINQQSYKDSRGRFYLFWNCIKTSGRPVLSALMAGAAAHQAEEASNETLVQDVTRRLATMFNLSTIPIPSEVIVTRWRRDPFARGTYSFVGPRTLQGDYDVMARPVGSVHFAGEATCGSHPATVHGAYLSGLRAASEVIDAVLGPITPTGLPLPPLPTKGRPAATPTTGSAKKPKFGYIDVWEPIDKPDPFYASIQLDHASVEYEARIASAIHAAVGPRPIPPAKQKLNPYILYTKDEWARCKTDLESQKPGKKIGKDEIRAQLGLEWRNAKPDVKERYISRCKDGREQGVGVAAEYEKTLREWEGKAAEVREQFIKENAPPASFEAGRKTRKQGSF